jgi:hypothetical protein
MDDLAEVTSHNSWPGQEMTERMSDPADLKEDKFTNRIARILDNAVVPRAEEPDPHVPFIVSGSDKSERYTRPCPNCRHPLLNPRHYPYLSGALPSNIHFIKGHSSDVCLVPTKKWVSANQARRRRKVWL